jgi:hypothetical protein
MLPAAGAQLRGRGFNPAAPALPGKNPTCEVVVQFDVEAALHRHVAR